MWEPKIKKMNLFVRILTFGWPMAITLAPFGIYIKEKYFEWGSDEYKEQNHPAYQVWIELINHESTHWKQQLEMLIIFFYLWYFMEWIIKFLTPPMGAYKDLSFEREANDHETDSNYNKIRKLYSWWKYMKRSQIPIR